MLANGSDFAFGPDITDEQREAVHRANMKRAQAINRSTPRLTPEAVAMLLLIAHHADESGAAYISTSQMAKDMRTSSSKVVRARSLLRKKGCIAIVPGVADKSTTAYRLAKP